MIDIPTERYVEFLIYTRVRVRVRVRVTSMYTNIDPLEGIETIRKYLKHFAPGFTSNECNIILKLLKLVMENCVFKFGENFWLQLIGTAMGTIHQWRVFMLSCSLHITSGLSYFANIRIIYSSTFDRQMIYFVYG